MFRKNARLFGMLFVLCLVLLAIIYFNVANQPKGPTSDPLDDMPVLGHVPTKEQIYGKGSPPPPAQPEKR